MASNVNLFPHQKKAVEELGNGKVLWGDVGTGKTLTALAYFYYKVLGCDENTRVPNIPMDVYVITTAKKRDSLDWPRDAAMFGISTHDGVGISKLTVDSWNNVHKYIGVKDAFFIFDEQRLVGTGAWVKSFYKIAKANEWILLTATPGDTWLDYAPVFIANGWYKNITQFRNEHVIYSYYGGIPKVQRYIGVNRLVKQRNALLVEMPYLRHTTRHVTDVPVEYDRDLFDQVVKKRWHPYEERPIRDVAELFLVMRKVAYSHDSRAETVKKLLEKHPKLIVFYNFDYELEALRKLGSSLKEHDSKTTGRDFAVQEWNGHKHEPIPTTDSWLYLVQYTAGAEGWNCVETDATVFYSLNYSYKITHQAMGRIDRLNTPYTDLYYYRLMSKSLIDGAVAGALKEKRKFNESAFIGNTRIEFSSE